MPIFDTKSLREAVNTALEESDVGKDKNALVVVATPKGVKAVISTRIGKKWEITQFFSVDHQKHIDGGIEVKATW